MYIESMPCGCCPAVKVKNINKSQAAALLKANKSFLFMGPDPQGEIAVNTIFYSKEDKKCYWLCLTDEEDGITVTAEQTTDFETGAQTIVDFVEAGFKISYGKGRLV